MIETNPGPSSEYCVRHVDPILTAIKTSQAESRQSFFVLFCFLLFLSQATSGHEGGSAERKFRDNYFFNGPLEPEKRHFEKSCMNKTRLRNRRGRVYRLVVKAAMSVASIR